VEGGVGEVFFVVWGGIKISDVGGKFSRGIQEVTKSSSHTTGRKEVLGLKTSESSAPYEPPKIKNSRSLWSGKTKELHQPQEKRKNPKTTQRA